MEPIDNIPTAEILEESHDHRSIPTAETADVEPMIDEIDAIDITDNMKQCYMLSYSLRGCVWCECLLAILASFSNIYLAIPLFLAYFGYIGAKNFNKNLVIFYFIYLTATNACRFYIFLHFFLPLTPEERDARVLSFILVIICAMMDIITSYITYLFYNSMKRLPAEDLEFIKLLEDHDLRQASMNNSS